MAAHESYDQERIVRRTEVHDQPTEPLRTTEVVRQEPDVVVREQAVHANDHVVHEDVVVSRPVVHQQHVDSAVSEDVSIDHVLARRALLDRLSSGIWLVVGLLEVAIGLRIAFKLLEANESSQFVTFVYGLTDPFVRPFEGIFNDPASGGAVLDSAAVMAMIIWALATWAFVRLLWIVLDRSESGARRSVREVRSDSI